MRLGIISDIHIGRYKYGKINYKTGLDLRTEDILKNIDETIDFAIKKKVDGFIITGDFYHKKKPIQIFRKLIASRINKLLQNKIDTYLLLGNHDQGKTSGHDLIELSEISDHIDRLHTIDTPQSFELKDTLLCFLPCVNRIDYNITDEFDFNLRKVRSFSDEASHSDKKYKLFFGHFGTDHSVAGKGFDLGFETKHARVMSLDEFKSNVWTRVYLGDIHKPQILNDFCVHVGSVAKVDFGEEFEQKGFCYFEDGKNEFIKISDREFKTLEVDLTEKPRDKMGKFCGDIQDDDLSKSVIRLKIKIKVSERKLINFTALEKYLQNESWKYIGKSITEIDDRREEITFEENEELDHLTIFLNYLKTLEDDIDKELYTEIKKSGKEILSEELNL